MKGEIKKLIFISRKVGCLPELVQGGGGNTSVKDARGKMYIKASGIALSDMTLKRGFAIVGDEGKVVDAVSGERPSMEVSMHLYLPKYVIHTHSVHVNIFTCIKNGRRHLMDFFKDEKPLYISYKNPGEELAAEIKEQVHIYKRKHLSDPKIIFLENHGLITCGVDSKRTLELTMRVNAAIKKHLTESIANFKLFTSTQEVFERPKRCLFPDMAVFQTTPMTKSSKEILAAHEYVLYGIRKLGATPRYLKSADVKYIQNMESEKHRMKVAMNGLAE